MDLSARPAQVDLLFKGIFRCLLRKSRRAYLLLVGIAMAVVLILAGCDSATHTQIAPASYSVNVLSSMTKIRQDEHRAIETNQVMKLFAACGEAESAQILIQAKAPLTDVKVRVEPLLGPQGASLPLEVLRVGYVPVKNPTPVGFGKPGLYPDPLLPLRSFDIKAGASQSLWVTAWVPRDAVSGEYCGSITLASTAERAQTITVRLHVYPVVIPIMSALRTHFESWEGGRSDQWYGKEVWAKMKPRFQETMQRYRLSFTPELPWSTVFKKGPDGVWTAQWLEFDGAVQTWLSKGITMFMLRRHIIEFIGGRSVPAEIPNWQDVSAKLKLFGQHLDAQGWSDRFAFYIFDEPIISDDAPKPSDRIGSDNIKNIKNIAQLIHACAPKLKVMIITCDPAYEAVALDFPVYIWCPHINHFHVNFQQRRQRLGEPNWMYVCMTTWRQKYPDIWRIDREGVSHRAIGAWLWHHRCDGFLFWCVDYWRKNPYEIPDIFRESVNGDGFLLYPDLDKSLEPFPSMRLAITRDAFEDYDLFALLRQATTKIRAQGVLSDKLSQLLARADELLDLATIISNAQSFAEDSDIYINRHREVLEVLEALGILVDVSDMY